MDSLAERIRHVLTETGKNQKELAKLVGVKPQAVGQWLHGQTDNIRMATLFDLEDKTGFAARWIATGQGPEKAIPATLAPLSSAEIAVILELRRAIHRHK